MEHRWALDKPVWELPALELVERTCVQQFMDSSSRLLARLDDVLVKAHKLTLVEFLVLDQLAKARSGSIRMGDLATEFALVPSRVTQLIGRLEVQALVGRRPHPVDRRAVLAHITDAGRRRCDPARLTYARGIRMLYLGQLSHQQAIALGDVCRRTGPPGPIDAE